MMFLIIEEGVKQNLKTDAADFSVLFLDTSVPIYICFICPHYFWGFSLCISPTKLNLGWGEEAKVELGEIAGE